jgi:hypothetical protein
MKPCLGGKRSSKYGECGWQPVLKVWYTDRTGLERINACVRKLLHT